MLPLNWLKERSSTATDVELMQKEDGTHPWKLLLLALMAIRFLVFSHIVDGNAPVNKLLEMLSVCSGCSVIEG
jgi:hypothetical protein